MLIREKYGIEMSLSSCFSHSQQEWLHICYYWYFGWRFFFLDCKVLQHTTKRWFDYTKLKQIPHPDQSHYLPSGCSLWKLIRESTEQWTWVKCLWGEVAHFMKTMNFECKIILAENNYHTIHCHLYNLIVNIQINNFFRTK